MLVVAWTSTEAENFAVWLNTLVPPPNDNVDGEPSLGSLNSLDGSMPPTVAWNAGDHFKIDYEEEPAGNGIADSDGLTEQGGRCACGTMPGESGEYGLANVGLRKFSVNGRVDSTRGLLTYPPQKPLKLTFCQPGANVCIFD
jgi:hypothetical protein